MFLPYSHNGFIVREDAYFCKLMTKFNILFKVMKVTWSLTLPLEFERHIYHLIINLVASATDKLISLSITSTLK